MKIASLLNLQRTQARLSESSKRSALARLAEVIAQSDSTLKADEILRLFLAREKLGSTGIGYGIAIPHCRISNTEIAIGALITLTEPVEFDSIDGEPVDILFAMLVPEAAHTEHLQHLAALANALSREQFREQLRNADTNATLFEIATQYE